MSQFLLTVTITSLLIYVSPYHTPYLLKHMLFILHKCDQAINNAFITLNHKFNV